jgi:hypothetical protein
MRGPTADEAKSPIPPHDEGVGERNEFRIARVRQGDNIPSGRVNSVEHTKMAAAIAALKTYEGVGGVIPLKPRRKEPIKSAWGSRVCRTPADVATVWSDHPDANIGVALNSEAIGLDIDVKHMADGVDPWASIERLKQEGVIFPETLTVRTATGGEHWIYEARPNPQRKNAVAFLPGLDMKTQGGYLVAVGSVIAPSEYADNPDGGAYEVTDNRRPAMAPDRLQDHQFIEELRRETSLSRIKKTTRNLDPKLLERWDGSTLYPSEVWSTVHTVVRVRMGFGRFLKHEPSLPTFAKGERHQALLSLFGWMRMQPWPNFEYWTRACTIAADLITPFYRQEDQDSFETLVNDAWNMRGGVVLDDLKVGQWPWESDEEYEARLASVERRRPLPFPVGVFPQQVQDLVNGLSEAYHVPTDFIGIPILSVASIAIGGVAKIAVSGTGWTQPLNLYAVSVGVPGSGKAEGLDHIDRPLRKEQERRREVFEAEAEKYGDLLRLWKIEDSVWQSKYKAWVTDKKFSEPSHTHSPACPPYPGDAPEKPDEPALSHVYATQGTIEGIARSMARSTKFGLLTDELSAFILGLNQYKGGKGSDKAFVMDCWKGTTSVILRADEDRTIDVSRPFLTIYGTIQPDVARILLSDRGWDDGFLDRWLFAYPDEAPVGMPGHVNLSPAIIVWDRIVAKLLDADLDPDTGEAWSINLSDEATTKWEEWQDAFNGEINSGASPRGPLAKLSQYLLRFVGVLHSIRWAAGPAQNLAEADLEDVEGAIVLFEYFRRMLNRVYANVFVDVTDVTDEGVTRFCKICGKDISTKRSDALVCGPTCRQRLNRAEQTVTDVGVTFVTHVSDEGGG